jgi:hypothetical protein
LHVRIIVNGLQHEYIHNNIKLFVYDLFYSVYGHFCLRSRCSSSLHRHMLLGLINVNGFVNEFIPFLMFMDVYLFTDTRQSLLSEYSAHRLISYLCVIHIFIYR